MSIKQDGIARLLPELDVGSPLTRARQRFLPHAVPAIFFLAVTHYVGAQHQELQIEGENTSPGSTRMPEAAEITYHLADTELTLSLSLMVDDCTDQGLSATPTLAVVPVPVRGVSHTIGGHDLAARLKKRDLTIALHENGTIKSINASTENRLAAVLGNVFKFATGLATMGTASFVNTKTICKPEVERALEQVVALRTQIANQRQRMTTLTDPQQILQTRQSIEALAEQVAELRTGSLRAELKTTVRPALPKGSSTKALQIAVEWPNGTLADLVKTPEQATAQARRFDVLLEVELPNVAERAEGDAPACDDNRCPFLIVREAPPTKLIVRAKTPASWRPSTTETQTAPATRQDAMSPSSRSTSETPQRDLVLAELRVPIGQFGSLHYLPLRARFGQSRTVKLEFDQFGRRTSFTWGSNAAAEGVTSGLVDLIGAANAYHTAATGQTSLQEQQARVTELETRLKLNKLLACEEILLAGGYACPQ
jgi:hypothetical protein